MGIGFAGVGRFIHADLFAEDDSAVGRDIISSFQLHQVAHDDIAFLDGVDFGPGALSGPADDFDALFIPDFLADIKLPVGPYLKNETDAGGEQDGQQDADWFEKKLEIV